MIALTVEEGEDWTDVQIPSVKKEVKPTAASTEVATAESIAPTNTTEAIHVETIPGVGPASNLRMAQYGINPR